MQAGKGHVTIAGCRETRDSSSTENACASSTVIRARPDGSDRRVESDTATLLGAAAVVRDRRHVGDRRDADAQRGESANRRFTTRARALDLDVEVLDALLLSSTTGHFGSDLGSERSRLARALKAL